MKKIRQKTSVYHNPYNVINTVIEFVDKANNRIDACVDYTRPSLAVDIAALKNAFVDAKERGVKLRYVTEITSDNVSYCKELINTINVDELRHIDGIKGNFYVSENEYVAPATFHHKGKPASHIIYSNVKEIVEHQQYVFESFWTRAIPAEIRIKDIEEGVESSGIEIIENPREAIKRAQQIIKLAQREVLRIYPSFNAFRRQIRIGAIDLFREALEHGAKVRILIPADEEQIIQIVDEMALELPQLDIRRIDKSLQTQMGIIVVDRKESLIVELRDDTKENYYDAAGLAAYSNSRPIALSYVSIFESLWKQGELYEQLKAYNMMQRDFINIAAHELRTPIQPILGLAQVVSPRVREQDREYMGVIIRNAKRLQRLTENILDVTKIDNHSLELQKERFNLNNLISSVAQDYRNQINNSNLLLVFKSEGKQEVDKNETIFVYADKSRLTQVVSNLLSNAIKFTKEGTICIDVEKKVREKEKGIKQQGEEAIVTVRDTGIGIDSQLLSSLFSRFITKSKKEAGGTGLGLFISKSIIEAHDGTIHAENNLDGKGATFSFTLPIIRNAELGDKSQ
jgi:two-component system sensor histidine kinase VicK